MQNIVFQASNGEASKRKRSFLCEWVSWQFWEMPRNILKAWKNFLKYNLEYFSVPLLLKTFFSPWRRYQASYGKGFDLGKYFEAFLSNLIFRSLGAFLRSFLIVGGLLVEVFILFTGTVIFFTWLILPALLIAGFLFGIKIII